MSATNIGSPRIGVIADTHGLLRPEVLEAFANVDHILHAGDIGGEHVLDALERLAPVTAVLGNCDADMAESGSLMRGRRRSSPATLERSAGDASDQPAAGTAPGGGSETRSPLGCDIVRVTIDGLRILLTHILPRPGAPSEHVKESLAKDGADVVVFGHSHLPHDEKVDGVRFLNPASAGPRRFDYPVSVAILEKLRNEWIACHVSLDHRSLTALGNRMNQLR